MEYNNRESGLDECKAEKEYGGERMITAIVAWLNQRKARKIAAAH